MSAALASIIARSKLEREDWRYTDLDKLLDATKPAPAPAKRAKRSLPCLMNDASQHQRIVFENGVLQADKSQLGDLPATVIQGDAANGYRLSLAAQSCLVTAPVELVFMVDAECDDVLKLAIDIGANTSVTIIEHHHGVKNEPSAQVIETDIHLHEQSKLLHEKIIHNLTDASHFARTQVCVGAGAYYRNFSLIKNARLMRNEIDVTLEGALAQCALSGVMLLRDHQHADVLTRVQHAKPHGISRQLYKAVVKDQARGVFQGRIKVAEGAYKSDGQQLCRALLLSDQAEMDAKPELEIYNDDVACSHGCAVGDLDADAMFYLRSRGLNEDEARALLLRAFVDEVIDTIQAEGARSFARDLAGGWMNE